MRLAASPETASMPSRIGLLPAVARARSARSAPSVKTASAPSARNSAATSSRRTTLMVRRPRALASTIRVPADRRVGDVLDHPIAGVQRNMVFEQELRRRWVDPQHRRLAEVEAGGDRDRVPGAHAATLGPVLAFEIDDRIAGLDIGHSGA